MDNLRKEEFQFVQLSHPQDAASWKRQVRSHAAKNARARQRRVVQYQEGKAKDKSESRSSTNLGHLEHSQQPNTVVVSSITTALSAARTDPFDTFVRKVTKFESFLLDHYDSEFRTGMATHWIHMAATDTGMLATLFLISCQNLSTLQHNEFYSAIAMHYKGQCIMALKTALAKEGDMFSDATITQTLALASEATVTGDHAAEQQHAEAAEKMVSMRGGVDALGMGGFLKKLVICPSPAQTAFNKAIREFKAGLKDQALYSQILATTSIDQVYDLTDQLQKVQGKGNHLRNLARIQRYLERMRGYTGAIDTFVQAKPDILALIWGPIKLLIQWTSTLAKSLDALLTTIELIGNLLPEFDHAAKLFGNKRHINEVLALLFQDVLDFYLVSLKFFKMERWKSFYEALWPKKKEEIERVIGRMTEHTYHLRNEVRMEAIEEAYDARQLEIENFARSEAADRRQEYAATETAISPTSYGKKLSFLYSRMCEGTGDWLIKEPDLSQWLQVTKGSSKVIWLCGIPGAGKGCILHPFQQRR
ncbi:hypothetical protein G7Z17_g1538 [Cylindrodendrum hubeiense]|uniref:Uncharacterized protein n=1 Tax=Cylindrodendrum hubeiense TaxID=595255 RepID=A0A9P5LL89_9HYPO|nr:hypothetical protein G7Z17_g1538 [Cylindrodendrum hubeiense]